MIPKIIHYCWFGKGEKTELNKYCIESWKKYMPDYQIIEWNEENIDINCNKYIKQAYENKKYAFVSDFARLQALYEYGGIYFDLDVEVKKNIDTFMAEKDVYSFESVNRVASAVIFAERKSPIIREWLDSYKDREYILNGKEDLTANVYKITQILKNKGFYMNGKTQKINGITLCQKEYFCPYGIGDDRNKSYDTSYTVHWCEGSWFDNKFKRKIKLIKLIKRVIGTDNYYKILKIIKKK